jgi:RNA polymerase sigma factor (sigma-70 family)
MARSKRREANFGDRRCETIGERAEERMDVDRILQRLDPACRSLLKRVFLDEATTAEVSHELGIAESSVRSKVSRCVSKARLSLRDNR